MIQRRAGVEEGRREPVVREQERGPESRNEDTDI